MTLQQDHAVLRALVCLLASGVCGSSSTSRRTPVFGEASSFGSGGVLPRTFRRGRAERRLRGGGGDGSATTGSFLAWEPRELRYLGVPRPLGEEQAAAAGDGRGTTMDDDDARSSADQASSMNKVNSPIFTELCTRYRRENPRLRDFDAMFEDEEEALRKGVMEQKKHNKKQRAQTELAPPPSSKEFCDEVFSRVAGAKLSDLVNDGSIRLKKTSDGYHHHVEVSPAVIHKMQRSRRFRKREIVINPKQPIWKGKVKQTLLYNQTVPFTKHRLMRLVPEWTLDNHDMVSYELKDITPRSWAHAKLFQHRFLLLKPGVTTATDGVSGSEVKIASLPRSQRNKQKTSLTIKINPSPVRRQSIVEAVDGRQRVRIRDGDDDGTSCSCWSSHTHSSSTPSSFCQNKGLGLFDSGGIFGFAFGWVSEAFRYLMAGVGV